MKGLVSPSAVPAGSGGITFLVQPGGTAGVNRFTTLAAACAAALLVDAFCPTIVLDGSNSGGIVDCPAGSYPILDNWTIVGRNFETLSVEDGARFTTSLSLPTLTLVGCIMLNKEKAAPAISTAAFLTINLENGAEMTSDASATNVIFHFLAGGGFFLATGFSGSVSGSSGGGIPIFNCDAGSSSTFTVGQFSTLGDNALTGAGNIAVVVLDPSAKYSQTQGGASAITYTIGDGTIGTVVSASNATGQTINNGAAAAVISGWSSSINKSPIVGGSFNVGSGVFTAPLDNTYEVIASCEYSSAGANLGAEFTLGIYVNGALIVESAFENPVAALSQKRQLRVQGTVFCSRGQTIDIRTAQNSGGNIALTNAAPRNFLSITHETGF